MTIAERQSAIRDARRRHGVGVRELARRMHVVPSAVTQWEQSERRGSIQIGTVERALAALGEYVVLAPRRLGEDPSRTLTRREERVALELHRAVAHHLIDDPESTLRGVAADSERIRPRLQGAIPLGWLDEWVTLAREKRMGELLELMLGTSSHAIDMRQVSPFAGVLSAEERTDAIRRASAT